jgi:kumamolisin
MADTLVILKGSIPINNHPLVGPVDPQDQIEITIKLRRITEKGLPTLKEFLAGKRAAGVTRQVLAERYGASREDAYTVQRWAVQQGLSVSRLDLGRRQMHLVGSLAAMSKAFGVTIAMYKHARTGVEFRSPKSDLSIPKKLASIITGVFGLNNMPVVVRNGLRISHKLTNADPKDQFPGSFYPNEVAKLYNFPPTTGSGQRVAVLEFGGGFDQTVLANYFKQNIGLRTPPTVNAIFVLGTSMQLSDPTTGEVYLDIEVIGAMAPEATIDVYFAPWTGQGYLNAIDQAIHNDDYAAISISYGLDEDQRGSAQLPGWQSLKTNVDEGFRDAAALGIPVFVSTGDQGSSSMRGNLSDGTEVTVFSKTAHAGYPSTSPYATAVGGTMLYAKNGSISEEIVWNELGPLEQSQFYFGGATGGGVSDRYKTVPSYQTGAGINPQSANTPSSTGRAVPDVAGNAGSTTGYLVSQPPSSKLPIAPVGGTSAAAPMWAALMACVREALDTKYKGKIPVFFLNDFIYACGKTPAFRDIVGGRDFTVDAQGYLSPGAFIPVGNNRSTGVNGYSASQGYDLCTGWGSPNGKQLLTQLESWLSKQKKPPSQSRRSK